MIKNNFKIVVLGLILTTTSVMADISGDGFTAKSLVGIEGGYSTLDYENTTSAVNEQYDVKVSHAGVKIGAETEEFRAFLSGRYYFDSSKEYDYIATYGLEIQYKLNVTDALNFYIGANAGIASMKFNVPTETFSRTISDPYIGGDIGANIHLSESLDWEIGGRVLSMQAENSKNSITYRIGNLVTAYTSVIFKWQMD